MEIGDFLAVDRVGLDLRVRDKAGLLHEVAQRFARTVPGLQADAVEAALLARERLGSTGLGNGFALPHARIEGLDRFLGLFVRLAKPIAFDAIDEKPVQLIFVLLIPLEEASSHVAALAAISRRFRNGEAVARVMKAETPASVFGFLTDA